MKKYILLLVGAFVLGLMLALLFQPMRERTPVPVAGHGSPSFPVVSILPSAKAMAQAVDDDDLFELRSRQLEFPVQGLTLGTTPDSFYDQRSGHVHEAIDILAPRNTPVVAVEDGKIEKLWVSRFGGKTIYQFDSNGKYCYYYAHLESYADISEGDYVKKGDIIGYVGTSGNAPPNTPHLHFTIFKLTSDKHWWEGEAINPYLIFKIPKSGS